MKSSSVQDRDKIQSFGQGKKMVEFDWERVKTERDKNEIPDWLILTLTVHPYW